MNTSPSAYKPRAGGRTLALVFLLVLAGPGPAQARDLPLPDAHETTLANGMKVLVLPDHDIPNCALHIAWRVGSRDERPGITGLAHFFEHMMFLGGEKYGKVFDTKMEAAGGSNNAWTTRDATTYVDWFPASALPLILGLEADRIGGMAFDPETVESERRVVLSERRLTMEEPIERLYEQVWSAAYTAHPYQWEIFGWPSDIRAWTRGDLEQFFSTYYSPQNAVLVLVGDVDPDAAIDGIRERLEPIPKRDDRPAVVTVEPRQRGERRVALEVPPGTLPAVVMAWHVPAAAHPDTPVLAVVNHLLLGGEASRLHERLVEEDALCFDVYGGLYDLQFDPSLFTVDAMVREDASTAAVERVVWEEIRRLRDQGPTNEELTAAVCTLRVDFLHRMQTIDGMADLLAETELFFNGWKNLPARLSALQAVTGDDVKRVVGNYFKPRNTTIGLLVVTETTSEDLDDGETGGER